MERFSRRLWTTPIFILLSWPLSSSTVAATEWQVPVEVQNAGGAELVLRFGIDPLGTEGIDSGLGEVELPPWPPSTVFDARLLIAATEGVRLDLRDDAPTERVHTIEWQEGDGGYPIIMRWDRDSLPAADLQLMDGYGGAFIPAFSMFATDSLVIPESQSFLRRLDIVAVPGEYPSIPPEITPAIPSLQVFQGQRFPEIALDDFVEDLDTPLDQLTWVVTPGGPPWPSIDENRELTFEYPGSMSGAFEFVVRVEDLDGRYDEQVMSVTILLPGEPSWEVALTVENDEGISAALTFGIDPDATDGVDAGLGEVALPPWPPSEVLDARLLLPDQLTHVARDIRNAGQASHRYLIEWQEGSGGYPVTLRWPGPLPPGEFTISDAFGDTFVPPTDMTVVDSLVVPADLSFIDELEIDVTPAIDLVPPEGPFNAMISAYAGEGFLLTWDPAIEDHFGYYEVWFDTSGVFDPNEVWVWDWTEDSELLQIETGQTIVVPPEPVVDYYAQIRAWDSYGNVGVFAEAVSSVLSDDPWVVRPVQAYPNPIGTETRILLSFDAATEGVIEVFDAAGRRVWQEHVNSSGDSELVWRGTDRLGRALVSGVYSLLFRTQIREARLKLVIVR